MHDSLLNLLSGHFFTSTSKPPQNSNGDECVIISDSDDDQEFVGQDRLEEQDDQDDEDNEDEGRVTGNDESQYTMQECIL